MRFCARGDDGSLQRSQPAQAACSSTLPAAGAFSSGSFAPLAAGGAINSLTSAINAANTIFLDQSTDFHETLSAPQQPGQPVGSVWARGMGGGQTTKGSTQSTYSLGGAFAGSTTCQTSTQLNFGGVQVGTDLSSMNYAGFDLHAGSSLGYLGATGKDTTSAGPANPFGGSLNNNLQIPFAGVYGVATKGNFFVSGAAPLALLPEQLHRSARRHLNQHVDARGQSRSTAPSATMSPPCRTIGSRTSSAAWIFVPTPKSIRSTPPALSCSAAALHAGSSFGLRNS